MIKTHKPRGYSWTHASAFQQTKEFRNICYDDCVTQTPKSLIVGPEEQLSEVAHTRKRRRIEKLADDFLSGNPLTIFSARPCPSSLKSTIIWNQRSSNQPKFALPEANISHDSAIVWQDVEDDEDILRRHRSRLPTSALNSNDADHEIYSGDEDESQAAPKVAPQAPRRSKSARITAVPSEEALKQAAALRARRAQKTKSEEAAVPIPQPESGRRLRSSDKRSMSKRSKQRLSPQRTNSSDLGQDGNSLDELRLSRVETPSNLPRASRPSTLSQSVAQLALSRRRRTGRDLDADPDTIVATPRVNESSDIGIREPSAVEEVHTACLEQNSYHTAPEETEVGDEEESAGSDLHSPDDSQTRLLKSHGFKGASPTSWRSVNQQQAELDKRPVQGTFEGDNDMTSASYTPRRPQSTSRRTRRTTTAGSENATQQATAMVSDRADLHARKQVIYRSEQGPANGSSPFKWRKRVAFPSCDKIVVGSRPEQPRRHPPRNVSQSAPVTPAATGAQPSSGLQNSFQRVDVARSSPALPTQTPPTKGPEFSQGRKSLPETWIGTQAMLYQAQRDLVTSPEKPGLPMEPANSTSQGDNEDPAGPGSQKSDREPLKQLSQEPMPSTQAMIGDFPGFSTVKKPWRGGPRESIGSPTVLLRTQGTISKASEDVSPAGSRDLPQKWANRNSSSLRFSIESVESPLQSTNVDKLPSTTTPMIRRAADWSSTNPATPRSIMKTPNPRNTGANTSQLEGGEQSDRNRNTGGEEESQSLSFSTAVPLPSFQAAQAWSSLPREDSNIGRTIDELTTELLDTRDMEGVLSQVG